MARTLANAYQELSLEWHPTKNGELTPAGVTPGSSKKVWWRCPKGPDHEWQARVYSRARDGRGCPFCSGRRVSVTGSLATLFPEIAKQWHPTRNGDQTPANVTPGVSKRVWWRCPEDSSHEWQAKIFARTHDDPGCPICRKQRVAPGGSLQDRFPELAAQWHPTGNGALRPADVPFGTVRRVWWQCPEGPDHQWQTTVNSRTSGRHGCPFCSGRRATHLSNLAVLAPELAAQWHPTKNGILVPDNVRPGSKKPVWWQCPKDPRHQWRAAVVDRLRKGHGCPYCSGRRASESDNLTTQFPTIAAQWHPTRNGDLRPNDVRPGSDKNVWWRCDKGPDHEWQTSVSHRTIHGSDCPFCSGRRLSVTNCLAARRQDLAAEWHPTKNGKLTPNDVKPGSYQQVWWQCPKGADHQWQTRVLDRNRGDADCPFCAGYRVCLDNCLATTHPLIAAAWHPERNAPLSPENVSPLSAKRAWWQCPEYHEHQWQAVIRSRTQLGERCPFCAEQRRQGKATLADLYPKLVTQWHPSRNGWLRPRDVAPTSEKLVWWKCVHGSDHLWQETVSNRTRRGLICPFCAGLRVSDSNCLLNVQPDLAAEWHPSRNGELSAADVTFGSSANVWWRCKRNPEHEWEDQVRRRARGAGCPHCGRDQTRSRRSLAAHFPDLVAEWHTMRNGDLSPEQVSPSSNRKVWWKCARDHIWYARIIDRAKKGLGCPTCRALFPRNGV